MNYFIILLMFCVFPQTGSQQELQKALKEGNADMIGGFFASEVEISIFNQEKVLPKEKAVAVVKNFYHAYEIMGFQKVHEGASKDKASQFIIGHLKSKEQQYRVFIYYEKESDILEINEFRIED